LITGLSFRLIFSKYFTGTYISDDHLHFNIDGSELFGLSPENAWWIGGLIAFLVWAAFNTAAYFKLKETEV
jgi:hypothetical protein